MNFPALPATRRARSRPLARIGSLAAALLLLVGITACAAEPDAGGASDTVVIGTTVSMDSMNPLNEQYKTFQFNAFDALVRMVNGNSDPEPRLATSWDRVDDLTWDFHLRQGVTFQDGTALTANDVVFSFNEIKKQGYATATWLTDVAGVEATDPATVRIKTTYPTPLLLNAVAQVFIVPAATWQKLGADGFSNAPVGTGPYRVTEFKPGSSAVFEAYDGFWGEKPVTKKVEVRIFSNANALQSALEAGEVDAAQELGATAMKTLAGDQNVKLSTPFSGNQNMLQLNTMKAPFNDIRVREAAVRAVDVRSLIDALTYGKGVPEDGQLPITGINGYSAAITRPQYDPDRARALLAEAGATGTHLVLMGMTSVQPLLEAVAAQLKAVGFDPEIRAVDTSVWVQAFRQGTDADIFYRGVSYSGFLDADRPFSFVSSGQKPFVQDPKWTELLQASRSEFDPAARKAKLEAASQYLLDRYDVLYTYGRPTVGATASGVSGLDFSTGLMLLLDHVSKEA